MKTLLVFVLLLLPSLALAQKEWTQEEVEAFYERAKNAPSATQNMTGYWVPITPEKIWVSGRIFHLWGYQGPRSDEDYPRSVQMLEGLRWGTQLTCEIWDRYDSGRAAAMCYLQTEGEPNIACMLVDRFPSRFRREKKYGWSAGGRLSNFCAYKKTRRRLEDIER